MNAQRRKQLAVVVQKLNALTPLIDEAKDELANVLDEETGALDALPDSQRDGDRGQAMQEAVDNMQEAYDELDNLRVDTLVELLESAAA